MSRLELSLLGGFHASVDGIPVPSFDTDKTRALLVYVSVESSRPHSRETLASLLWPELPDDAARRNLRNSLFKLRQALGEDGGSRVFLAMTVHSVQLDPAADCRLDAAAFSSLIAACRTHRHRKPAQCATCYNRLREAAELYQGDFLTGFHLPDCQEFEEWRVLRREALHREALDALVKLVDYHQARGEYEEALRYAYREVELEPWREEGHRSVMTLLALLDRRSEALAQYVACRRALAEELDAEPAEETTALYERIKAGDQETSASTDHSALGTRYSALARHNLPRQLSPFIGRAGEIERIIEQLDSPDYSLVTLTGPGGAGKSRLALQVAAAQVGAFGDGVFWVPLAALDSPELVTSAIAQAVGLRFEAEGDPRAQLLDYLRDSEMLLVLDNFEQLLGAGGNTATDLLLSILKSAPRISMLVTSRERLGLQAEFLLDLAGLNLPGGDQGPGVHGELMQFDAVQLFVERAQQSHSQFALSNDTAQGVVDICTLVEGLPLGIILAAASTRQFSPARIAEAIRTNLDFLTSSLRDATPQHRSLRAVFNHSWGLLTEEEQRVFRGLSVFRGGWEEEAAETILGSGALYPLLSLVDKSLLRRDASGRLEMHEVLRQYATEKLAELPEEQDDIRRRHAAFYLDLARSAEQGLKSDKQGEWLERLEREHDNLRAVLYWAREHGEVLTGLQLGGALWRFWYVRGYYSEGSEHLASVLAMPVTTGPAQDAPQSPPTELARARATVLNAAGVLTTVQGNPTVARSLYEESLALSRDLEDKQGMASSLSNLAIIAHQEGASDAARALQEESLALRRGLGDKQGIAASLNNLGLMAQETGDHARAHTLHEESLALRRELGDTLGIASSLGNLGLVAQELGDYTQARALYQESLTIRRGLGDKAGMAELFTHLGSIAQKQGDYDAARDLYEQGLTLAREMGYRWSIALLLNHLGLVAQELGDYDRARALHEESLTLRRDLGERAGIIGSIISLAAAIARKAGRELERAKEPREPLEQLERAATLFGAADTLLESTPSVLSSDDRRLHEQNLALVQSLLNEEAFTKAWELGRGMSLEDAVDYALP